MITIDKRRDCFSRCEMLGSRAPFCLDLQRVPSGPASSTLSFVGSFPEASPQLDQCLGIRYPAILAIWGWKKSWIPGSTFVNHYSICDCWFISHQISIEMMKDWFLNPNSMMWKNLCFVILHFQPLFSILVPTLRFWGELTQKWSKMIQNDPRLGFTLHSERSNNCNCFAQGEDKSCCRQTCDGNGSLEHFYPTFRIFESQDWRIFIFVNNILNK
jgi:hypothetical protein